MNSPHLDPLLSIGKQRRFDEMEAVFQLGRQAEAIFRIISGEVHLYRHGREGKRILLHRAYDGDFFAEASLNSTHYHCTAICVRPTKLQVFNANEVRGLLRRNPDFSMAWISRLSSELRRQRTSVERLNLKSAAERVSHYLMTEGAPLGELLLRGTLSELAEMLGLSREALYRTLAKMQKQGTLERTGDLLRLRGMKNP
ncbi:MAG: Crp/Fnr family transcriptional regulator [Sedimenticola sp.]